MGDTTFVNVDDVWQECGVNPEFSGIPILMHYDPTTQVSSFIGQSAFQLPNSALPWTGELLTLPAGFHFNKIDSDIAIFFAGAKQDASKFTLDSSGRTISAKIVNGSLNSSMTLINVSFGYIAPNTSFAGSSIWHTTTVVPD